MIGLLFMVASIDGVAAAPPPPPPVEIAQAVTIVKDEPVPCRQRLGCGSTEPGPVVRIDTLDGYTAETGGRWDRGAVATVPGYSARLDRDLCEIKPWFC
jgi:hypothetical protein